MTPEKSREKCLSYDDAEAGYAIPTRKEIRELNKRAAEFLKRREPKRRFCFGSQKLKADID